MLYTMGALHLSRAVKKPMDIFGARWNGHDEKIENNWRKKITAEDTVVIPGDISWAMTLDEARSDFDFIESLPGKKIMLKVMISHDLQGALKYGTKILHMESGAYFFGTTAEYRSTDIFHAMSTCDCHCTCDHHTGSKEAR